MIKYNKWYTLALLCLWNKAYSIPKEPILVQLCNRTKIFIHFSVGHLSYGMPPKTSIFFPFKELEKSNLSEQNDIKKYFIQKIETNKTLKRWIVRD